MKLAIALVACVLSSWTLCAEERPNIVLIFTDDQGYADVGVFGATEFKTPHIDSLARDGMKFTDFYCAAPVCSASRAALLTGSYPPRVGINGVLFPRHKIGLNPDEHTIADVLKKRGYATACIGKWHLGHLPKFLPTSNGFDLYYGIPYSNDMDKVAGADKNLDRNWEKNTFNAWNVPLLRNEKEVERPADQRTLTKRYTEESVRFIRENKDRPFFLYLPHTMPHIPLFVDDAFRGKSGSGPYGDTIEELDWSVGQILATLRELDLEKKTLVVFTTDNGPWLSMKHHGGSALPLRSGKFTVYEGGMRVPCLMRWPGMIPAGKTCSEVAATIDLLPTFAEVAGAKLADDRKLDGKSITALFRGVKNAKSPHAIYCFYKGGKLHAVRSGKWKLHLARKNKPPKTTAAELYDLSSDIGETKNVAKANADVVATLTELAKKYDEDLQANRRPAGSLK